MTASALALPLLLQLLLLLLFDDAPMAMIQNAKSVVGVVLQVKVWVIVVVVAEMVALRQVKVKRE